MITGLYRTNDLLLGPAVRVHWSAGDAAPLVAESIYTIIGGNPRLEDLPLREDYARQTARMESDPFELA